MSSQKLSIVVGKSRGTAPVCTWTRGCKDWAICCSLAARAELRARSVLVLMDGPLRWRKELAADEALEADVGVVVLVMMGVAVGNEEDAEGEGAL